MAGTLSIEQILALLAGGPPRIAADTAGKEFARLHARPNPDEWSANEVLAHLRACADVWGGCIVTILEQDHPTIKAVSPRTWMPKTDYLDLEFPVSLNAFTSQRNELVAILESIQPEDWTRSATVKGAGKTLERTVHYYAQWLAEHERSHVKQIAIIVRSLRP